MRLMKSSLLHPLRIPASSRGEESRWRDDDDGVCDEDEVQVQGTQMGSLVEAMVADLFANFPSDAS